MNPSINNEVKKEPLKITYRRVRTPTIIQMEVLECGAACLGMILGYYGKNVPLEELRVACGISKDGSNALNIIRAGRGYGLEGKGFRKEYEDLFDVPLPFIAHWSFQHFVVIEGFGKDWVYINDPGSGSRAVSYSELDICFTGVVLTFTPGVGFKKSSNVSEFASVFTRRIALMKSGAAILLGIGLLLVILQLTLVGFSQVFMDYLVLDKAEGWTWYFIGGMSFVTVLIGLLATLRQKILARFYLKLALVFSTQFFWHIISLPISFFTQRFSGEIATRMSLNDGVAASFVRVLSEGVLSVFLASLFGLALFYYDTVIASVATAIVLLNGFLIYYLYRSRQDAFIRYRQEIGKTDGYAIGGLINIETLKVTSSESKFFSRFAGYYTKVLNSLQNISENDIISGVVPVLFEQIATLTVVMLGVWRVMGGHITIGMLLSMMILIRYFTSPIFTLLGLMQSIQLLKVDNARLDDILKNPVDPVFEKNKDELVIKQPSSGKVKLEGYLEVKNVTFGFNPNAAPLIRDINFTLTPGKSIALVGHTGCGKSTIAKLVGGLYRPWQGDILLDGVPREEQSRALITNSLSIVEQEISLFTETVKDNITLMEAYPLLSDLIQAAKDACIHEDILKRKGGYDLLLEGNGSNVSGGQRQRIQIARALYRNPTILVLDEATSALDTETEVEVMRNIRRRGCSSLIVAHRLSTIKNCDEILVISRGTIAQRGTHLELSEQEGLYKTLVDLEKLSEEQKVGI